MITIKNNDCCLELPLMPSNSVDLVVTSPPYFNAKDYEHSHHYERSIEDFSALMYDFANYLHRVVDTGRFVAINSSPVIIPRQSRSHSSKRIPVPFIIHDAFKSRYWDFMEDIVWEKPHGSSKSRIGSFMRHMRPLAYKPDIITESIFIYRKKTSKLIDWNIAKYTEADVKNSLVPKHDLEKTNIWKIAPVSHPEHPAVMPLNLAKKLIQYYSFVGDTVLDPFAGIGTTGAAASLLKRNAILIEYNKRYCDIMTKKFSNKIFV